MSHDASDDPALDDDYRSLFRTDAEDAPEPIATAHADPPAEATSTGRLFRSAGVDASSPAILALRPEHARKLRSTTIDAAAPESSAAPLILEGLVDEPGPAVVITERPARTRRRAPGLRPGAVYLIDVVAVVAFGFLDVAVRGDGLGWITGLGLILVSVGTAFVVRRNDWQAAVIAPPLAFLAAAATAGQMDLGPSGASIVNRVAVLFFTLGANWVWLVLAVAAAFVMTWWRRRSSQP